MRSTHPIVLACTAALLAVTVGSGPARSAVVHPQTHAALQTEGRSSVVTVDEASWLVRQDAVVLIDVRESWMFERAHLPGAVSMPLDELAARAEELRAWRKPVVVYCCSQGGVASDEAVAVLRGLGFQDVRAIAGGFQSWVNAGFVVEVPPGDGD